MRDLIACGYQFFQSMLDHYNDGLSKKKLGLLYSDKVIKARLLQEVTTLSVKPFMSVYAKLAAATDKLDPADSSLKTAEINYHSDAGAIKPRAKLFAVSAAKFVLYWCYILFLLCAQLLPGKRKQVEATLCFGFPGTGVASKPDFSEFCDIGPVTALNEASLLILQGDSKKPSAHNKKIKFSRFPLLGLLRINKLPIAVAIKIVGQHFSAFLAYLRLLLREPMACILWRDFAEHAVATGLTKQDLISGVFITNSNWERQLLWMMHVENKKFETAMLLYSLNSTTLMYKHQETICEHPSIAMLNVDKVYIWDEDYKRVLDYMRVKAKSEVVAPVVWLVPKKPVKPPNESCLTIALFDVTPLNDLGYTYTGLLGSYYSLETMQAYINGVLAVCDYLSEYYDVAIKVKLKHKRAISRLHHSAYIEFIDELVKHHSCLELVSSDSNIFDFIGESNLVISVPFSSPAYVAKYLQKPACYYDSLGALYLPEELRSDIPLLQKKDVLCDFIVSVMNQARLHKKNEYQEAY